MADLNGLKLSNDVFGHSFGDTLLQRAAFLISEHCRSEDIVARVGGDEFEVVLPRTSLKEAEQIADRIRKAAQAVQVGPVQLSISIGCASRQHLSDNFQVVRRQAEDSMYRAKTIESPQLRNRIIEIIRSKLWENPHEARHAVRCGAFCEAAAGALGLGEQDRQSYQKMGQLHDLGKIILPSAIINKPAHPTRDEWDQIHRHAEASYRILSSLNEYAPLADAVLAHHERWDGTGYPRGLAGAQIPQAARIMAIADTFEALTSDRPWRPAMSFESAAQVLRDLSGSQFDPELTRLFLEQVAPLFAAA